MAGRKTHNVCPAASTREVSFLAVQLCGVGTESYGMGILLLLLPSGRSMNLLFVPRPGGKWSIRSKLRGWSAGEPNLLIWSKQER